MIEVRKIGYAYRIEVDMYNKKEKYVLPTEQDWIEFDIYCQMIREKIIENKLSNFATEKYNN